MFYLIRSSEVFIAGRETDKQSNGNENIHDLISKGLTETTSSHVVYGFEQ